MGEFWDAFVFRVWAGLGEGHHPGFQASASLMCLAFQLGLLSPTGLNDLSLVLILLTIDSAVTSGRE